MGEHSWIYPCDAVKDRPNLGYIEGTNMALAVDAGHSSSHVMDFYDALEKEMLPLPDITVITHWHWDHTFGMHAVHGKTMARPETNTQLERIQQEMRDDQGYAKRFINSDVCIRREYAGGVPLKVVSAQEAVKAARAAYNGLTAEQKKLVSQAVLSKLSSAETQVANAKNQTNSGSQSGEKKADGQKQAAYNKAVSKAKALKVTKPKTKAAKKKKAKVSWSATKGASGYEIQYGLKKNFKKAKTVTANGTAKKATLKKLKVGKKYFVRIRPFTNVINVNGKTEKVYGAWSKTMKIKAKK